MSSGRRLCDELTSTSALVGDLAAELAGIIDSPGGAAMDDEHDAEGSTIGFERARVSALLEAARLRLDDLTSAQARLDGDTYGRCDDCGGPIGEERLDALPETGTCVNCSARRSGPLTRGTGGRLRGS